MSLAMQIHLQQQMRQSVEAQRKAPPTNRLARYAGQTISQIKAKYFQRKGK